MRDSMALSFATATVKPKGSKLACDTQLAIMAERAPSCAAVTTYRPLLMRARALATSADMACFLRAITSLAVRAWARSVPASSNCWYSCSSGVCFTRRGLSSMTASVDTRDCSNTSTGSSTPPKLSAIRTLVPFFTALVIAAKTLVACASPEGGHMSTRPLERPTVAMTSCGSALSKSIISVCTPALVMPLARVWLRRSLNPYSAAYSTATLVPALDMAALQLPYWPTSSSTLYLRMGPWPLAMVV
mmetsp:Transcript_25729/g.69840  ORF Transcript_25729/g.69840 Transcript_25729/m.69840 type:complete len:246 (-) Transcript_25729:992-1729(-)